MLLKRSHHRKMVNRLLWCLCYFMLLLLMVDAFRPSLSSSSSSFSSSRSVSSDQNSSTNDYICPSVDIRNSVIQFRKLNRCTVVEGSVQILLIENASSKDFENLSFPLLREITDHLLLYRVQGLITLRKLFPNLAVIKGQALFHNYALVIFEMRSMHDIGLVSLTSIPRGSVRIEKNSHLCYVENIEWDHIAKAGRGGHFIKDNVPYEQCPNVCPSHCPMGSNSDGKHLSFCWNSQTCQKICPNRCEHDNLTCSSQESPSCCHRECLGGCTGPTTEDCIACRHVTFQGRCLPSCPHNTYEYLGYRCLTEEDCRKNKKRLYLSTATQRIYWKPFNRECVPHCPAGFMESISDKHKCSACKNRCPKVCDAAVVDSVASAQKLRGCTYIDGQLEIQIQGGDNVIKELELSLSSIREIRGYLKIARSFPLISLNFLKDLTVIHGERLDKQEYALLVLDNQNLQELWDWKNRENKLKVSHGKIFFHFNSKLCPSKINELKEHAEVMPWDDRDVSPSSNGDRVACNVIKLNIFVWDLTCRMVGLKWMNFQKNPDFDFRSLLGYVVYYREAPDGNVTKFDGRDACGSDLWKVDDIEGPEKEDDEVIIILPQLKPYTRYAAYMKTYTIASALMGAESDIIYFTTSPSTPSPPVNVRARSSAAGEIVVSWAPPKKPNGFVTHYIVDGMREKDFSEFVGQRNYCAEPLLFPRMKKLLPTNETTHKEAYLSPNATSLPSNSDQRECCSCSKSTQIENEENDAEFQIDFEDFLHNSVYIKNPDPEKKKIKKTRNTTKGLEKNDKDASIVTAMSIRNSLTLAYTKGMITTTTRQPPTTTDMAYANVNKTEIKSENKFRHVIRESSFLVIKNLHHFTEYTIEIRACQEARNTSCTNASECSTQAMTIVRTLPLGGADDIDEESLSLNIDNITAGTVFIKWDEPKDPNGLIVSYDVEYRITDLHDYNQAPACITQLIYNQKNGIGFHDLMPGNYSLRVRATSLAGNGNWTKPKYFLVPDTKVGISPGTLALIILTILFIICLFCGGGTFYLKRKYGMRLPEGILYASVNPEYVSAGLVYEPDEWEVPREKIKILEELGQGSFGMVYKGEVKGLANSKNYVPCAIKTVNDSASIRERIEFLQEASVMKAFRCHHIVNLLGVVSKGHPTLVIMELMSKGDLKAFLRLHRPDTIDGDMVPPTYKDILQMAVEIADGMSYLSAKKFVHRDLAARNCMVAEDNTVKIGDFGMTRDIYETDYYRKGGKGLLPVRWMAPECLKDGVFSCQSDIWSYGVVLWEMATFASQPYQGLANEQVLNFVISGRFMEKPENCPEMLYALMKLCWEFKPKARPTFSEIIEMLLPGVDESKFNSVSYYFSHKQEVLERENRSTNSATTATPLRNCMTDLSLARSDLENAGDVQYFPANREIFEGNYIQSVISSRNSKNNFDLPELNEHGAVGGNHDVTDYTIHSNESSKGMSVNSSDGSKGSKVSNISNGSIANGHVTFSLGRTTTC